MSYPRVTIEDLEKMVRTGSKKFVRAVEGAKLYSLGLHTFQQLGKDAGAVYRRDWLDGVVFDDPADFRGHSLSVSDIIVLHQDGVNTAYYVDTFGFKQVPVFTAANPLEKVEELLEDDYGMIDGIINNGSRKEEWDKAKKPSVLEKLKEKKLEAEGLAAKVVPVPKRERPELDR